MRDVLRCRLLLALSRGGVASWTAVGRWRGLLRRAAIGRAGAIEAEGREMEVAAGGDVVEGAMRCERVGGSSWRWTRMRSMRLEVLAKVKTRAEMRRRFHCSQSRCSPSASTSRATSERQNKHTPTQSHKDTEAHGGGGQDGGAVRRARWRWRSPRRCARCGASLAGWRAGGLAGWVSGWGTGHTRATGALLMALDAG